MIAENLVHFARILRDAGLSVGPDRVLEALRAIEIVGLDRRDDVHAALSAVMIDRHDQQPLFDAAFAAFWRDPKLMERMMHMMLPKVSGRRPDGAPRPRRLQEALAAPQARPAAAPAPAPPAHDEIRFDAALTFSERERLQRADFESMSAEEFDWARRVARELPLPVNPVVLRRREPAERGRIDLRATLRRMARQPHTMQPSHTRRRTAPPPLVLLLDISGSMERYARLFLHYAHGLTQRYPRVQTLTFGTRLTHITRSLRHRDPDDALRHADARVQDWRGGTRIAASLAEFNRAWARRLLTGNAALILVTDGLDRDEQGGLTQAAAQLRRLAHQVVWLNPLLRFDGFEPRAAGVRALLPHVDHFLPMHNLASLEDLASALRRPPSRRLPLPTHDSTLSLHGTAR